jgi:hypothetical protein
MAPRAANLLVVAVAVLAATTAARPFRGSIKWSVLLCKFKNAATPPRTPEFYTSLILTRGTGGLADYWHGVSYGSVNTDGTVVKGW